MCRPSSFYSRRGLEPAAPRPPRTSSITVCTLKQSVRSNSLSRWNSLCLKHSVGWNSRWLKQRVYPTDFEDNVGLTGFSLVRHIASTKEEWNAERENSKSYECLRLRNFRQLYLSSCVYFMKADLPIILHWSTVIHYRRKQSCLKVEAVCDVGAPYHLSGVSCGVTEVLRSHVWGIIRCREHSSDKAILVELQR
jgi:hypothetical protein